MIGALIQVAIVVAQIWALIWALTSLAALKRGQAQILTELSALRASQGGSRSAALPHEALLESAPEQ